MTNELHRQLLTLKRGEHVCPIYETAEERLTVAVPFIQQGLAQGERCLYVADDDAAREFLRSLADTGVDVAGEQRRDALRVLSKRDPYLRSGEFTPDAAIEFLRREESQALTEGRSGLRIVQEMAWALGPEIRSDRVVEFEALLNDYLRDSRTAVVCQYDRTRFKPSLICEVLPTHPLVIVEKQVCRNPFYEPPQIVLGQASAAEQVDWKIAQLKQSRSAERLEAERDALLHQLRLQIDRLPLAYILLDADHRVLDWNPVAERMFGYLKAETLGRICHELIDGIPLSDRLQELLRRIDNGDLRSHSVHENRTKDGRTITCEWFNTPLLDAEGKLIGLITQAQDITERRRDDESLREYAKRLKNLSRRVLEVQEEERRHLARELHDEIGQVLSTLSVNLQGVLGDCQAGVRSQLEDSLCIIDQAILQVRKLAIDLRPSMLDDLGLFSTVRWFADRHAQRAGFVLHLDVKSPGRRLPSNIETAGYRVVQEAMTNVVRHARAGHVWLTLEDREKEVSLEIRDDGAGFDVAIARTRAVQGESFGVLGMQERVELLGGEIEIHSRPGGGTTIRVSFPIESRQESNTTGGADEADPSSARR